MYTCIFPSVYMSVEVDLCVSKQPMGQRTENKEREEALRQMKKTKKKEDYRHCWFFSSDEPCAHEWLTQCRSDVSSFEGGEADLVYFPLPFSKTARRLGAPLSVSS